MPVKISYVRNGRVAVFRYSNPVCTSDVIAVFEEYYRASSQSCLPMHCISDASNVVVLPKNILRMLGSNVSPLRLRNTGAFIVVTERVFIKALMDVVRRLMPRAQIVVFTTFAEAMIEVDRLLEKEQLVVT
jgi:hypothetical protein